MSACWPATAPARPLAAWVIPPNASASDGIVSAARDWRNPSVDESAPCTAPSTVDDAAPAASADAAMSEDSVFRPATVADAWSFCWESAEITCARESLAEPAGSSS